MLLDMFEKTGLSPELDVRRMQKGVHGAQEMEGRQVSITSMQARKVQIVLLLASLLYSLLLNAEQGLDQP